MKTFKEVLARYKLSDLKKADIDKLLQGTVVGAKAKVAPISPVAPAKIAFLSTAFPSISAAMDTYTASREAQRQADQLAEMEAYPGLLATQPYMREVALGNASLPTPRHRHRHSS